MQLLTATVIDPTTRDGFLEIAASHGRPAAHDARIAVLKTRAEAAMGFRWHADRIWREHAGAVFEREFERTHPRSAKVLRESGIGY